MAKSDCSWNPLRMFSARVAATIRGNPRESMLEKAVRRCRLSAVYYLEVQDAELYARAG
jgi:hypothetical protein